MPKTYSPIKKTKAADLIVEEIWSAILNGELKPGEHLPPERELVKQFEVSKVTLREALQTLEANGYIERKRGASGGSFVRELSPTKGLDLISEYLNMQNMDIDELINARFLIEPLICEQATENITPEQAHQLELLLEKHRMEFEATGKSKFGWHFELYIAKLTGNKLFIVIEDLLISLVKTIEGQFSNSSSIGESDKSAILEKYHGDTFYEHKIIIEHILNKNSEDAKSAMVIHRQNWAKIFKKMYKMITSND